MGLFDPPVLALLVREVAPRWQHFPHFLFFVSLLCYGAWSLSKTIYTIMAPRFGTRNCVLCGKSKKDFHHLRFHTFPKDGKRQRHYNIFLQYEIILKNIKIICIIKHVLAPRIHHDNDILLFKDLITLYQHYYYYFNIIYY